MLNRGLTIVLVCLGLVAAGLFVSSYWMDGNGGLDTSEPPPWQQKEEHPAPPPTLYVEPEAGFEWLYARVQAAKNNLDAALYELRDPVFSAALVRACQRGVTVRVILDQNVQRAANVPAFRELSAAGPRCRVAWANPHFQAMHETAVVLDGQTAVVMTDGLAQQGYATTRSMVLVDTDEADAISIRAQIANDFGSTESDPEDPGVGHNLIWSPTTAEDDLVSLIQGAKKTLVAETEALDAPVVVNALLAACRRGVRVEIAVGAASPGDGDNFKALEAAGCAVRVGAADRSGMSLHANAMVADRGTAEAVGYLGSIRFQDGSMNRSRELGVYVHDPAVLARMAAMIGSGGG